MKNFCLIIGSILSAICSQAQQDSTKVVDLNSTIIQEKRLSTPFNKHARNIEVINKEDIKNLPVKSVNELLAYVGGVDVRQRGPFGTQADVSIDGGTFEQTMVLINGVKLMDAQTAHNMMNLTIPLEAMERIEVLRGPAARIYGINSLTGAINIVTKRTDEPFIALNVYGGSSFQKKEAGDGNGIYGGLGGQLTANYGTNKTSHLLSISKDNYNGQRYNTAQNNAKVFYNGDYKVNANHKIGLLGSYAFSDFGANGYYAAPGDKNAKETVETTLMSVYSQHKYKNVTITPRVSNRYNEDDYKYFKDNPSIARSMHYSNALMAEINAAWQTKIGAFGFGWESRMEKINSSNIGKHKRNNHGFFAEYKNTFNEKWVTNFGAYINFNSSYGWQIYPGADIAYLFLPGWKIAASANSGQRIPSFTDLYLNQLPGNLGNPNLKPENAWQYEAKVEYNKNNIYLKASYFYRNVNQFIDWIRDSITMPYSPYNLGRNQIHGFNIKVAQTIKIKEHANINYSITYNFLNPSIRESIVMSKYVLESLKNQLIGSITYSNKELSLTITGRYIERELNKPYFILDARAAYKFMKNMTVYADISNALGAKYIETGAVPMPSRWITLGLNARIKYI